MVNLFLIFFCLLPWGGFFFRYIDCWSAQGHFIQAGILILFCYSFFEKPKYIQPLNKSLGLFLCWAGLVTSYGWIKVFAETKHYPVKIFMPFFNLLCLVILYKLIVEYLDKSSIERILKWFRYSVILLLIYCVIQYLKLDEFLVGINNTGDQLVGTIGNSMHLSGLLAILQPLFFHKTRENILSLILLWSLILITGSASGLVAGIAVILFWLWFKNRKLSILISVISFIFLISLHLLNNKFFYNNSRLGIWQQTFGIIKDKFITGFGLGTFAVQHIKKGEILWQHAHNEYLQIVFELGLVGLLLVLWCIWDYFKKFNSLKTDLSIRLASMFFGFCLLCGVTFFSHIWITSTIGVMAYAVIYMLKNEELNQCAPV